MADLLYDNTIDEWRNWDGSSDFDWLALNDTYTPDRSHTYVSDVAYAELTGGGYSRQTATGRSRYVDTTLHRIVYQCNDPNFGAIAPGVTISYVVVAQHGASDSTSLLLALYDITDYVTDGSPFYPAIGPNGAHHLDQAPAP